MAWTLLAHTAVTTGDASSVTTPAIDTTGADLLVAGIAYNGTGAAPTLSDSYGNTWTGLGTSTVSSVATRMFYVQGGTVGAGHTFSATGALSLPNVVVAAFSGSASSPLDGDTGAIGQSGGFPAAVTSLAPGSLTPSEVGELVITTLTYNPDEAVLEGAGFTLIDESAVTTSRNVAMAYQIQRPAVTVNPTWTWTTASFAASRIASFKILDYELFANLLVASTWSEDKTASQSSFTFPASGTWTPNASELVAIGVGTRKTTGPSLTPTLTGTGGWNITWDRIADLHTAGSTLVGLTVFWGVTTDAGAGTLTVDYGGTNHAQCGVVALSGANVDITEFDLFNPEFTVGDSTDGSIGIPGWEPAQAQVGSIVFGVSRGTPSDFTPEANVHPTTVTGGVMGITGAWIEGEIDLNHVGDFTSGSNTAAVLFEADLTGARMAQGQTRNGLVF